LHFINRRKDRKPETLITDGKEIKKAPEKTVKESEG
jgi:hypothetical protein